VWARVGGYRLGSGVQLLRSAGPRAPPCALGSLVGLGWFSSLGLGAFSIEDAPRCIVYIQYIYMYMCMYVYICIYIYHALTS
jgi:hypothetical protein